MDFALSINRVGNIQGGNNMKHIVVISETETDIHVHMDGDNIDILRGIALILKEMDDNGFPLSFILEYIKSEVEHEHN